MNIVIFGVGIYWNNRKHYFNHPICNDRIVGYIDNYKKHTDDIEEVSDITLLKKVNFDAVLIMCKNEEEINEQLLGFGVEKRKILTWDKYIENSSWMTCNQLIFGKYDANDKPSLAILAMPLDYTGGSVAAISAAKAIKNSGRNVVIVTSMADNQLMRDCIDGEIAISLCCHIQSFCDSELKWLSGFECVIVNTFPMYHSVLKLSGKCPILWWIHEASDSYSNWVDENVIGKLQECSTDIYISPVSTIAANNFSNYVGIESGEILNYGIPDCFNKKKEKIKKDNKLIFAIIGTICERKAQDVFLKAFDDINYSDICIEKWIIGQCGKDEYSIQIVKKSESDSTVKMLGLVGREEISNLFQDIDVLVCPSREDPLPIVCTEAFMNCKPVIVSDNTGTASFIRDGVNGLVCKAGNPESLAEKINWMIRNKNKHGEMGDNVRMIYDTFFSMDVFEANLEKAILSAKSKYESEKNR